MQVEFEQTHIIRPAPRAEVRRFAQTFRWDPFRSCCANSLFGALGHYVILMQYTPIKPCCQAIFRISGRFFCQVPPFSAHTEACTLCLFWALIFCFCTFSPKTPLCILYRLTLVFRKAKAPRPAGCFCIVLIPDNPSAVWRGWGGGAYAGPWLRSGGYAPV